MLEAKYYRDYGHNYMILQCMQNEAAGSYQYKVLTSGRIGELLPCSVRHVNGSTYYYYDISSRTSLDSMFRGKKMSCEQVKDILRQIHGIYEKLAGYFMEESGLVLLPEHIYYDITSRRYIGLYYPDHRPEECGGSRALADFLLDHIDTENRDLAEKMCRICELAEDNCFFEEDALRILEEGEEPEQPAVPQISVCWEEGESCAPGEDGGMTRLPEPEGARGRVVKKSIFYRLFAVLSVCGIAGAVAVYSVYGLTRQEEFILYGVMAVMGICLFLCIAGMFAEGRRKSVSDSGGREELPGAYDAEFERAVYGDPNGRRMDGDGDREEILPSLAGVIGRDMDLEMAGYGAVPERECVQRVSGPSGAARTHQPPVSDGYGNTVFFDGSADRELKLYALDRKNKNHIELKRFPYTVGKMAGCVDHVLSDDSVSRIHARFDMQGERLLLTDMNSTNGTYKNGLRMQPQETVELEPGDEIRFGSLNYCYR